ncbi:PilZ domain-containing protein [Aestuariibacter halophilus]|uniref:PilZ domain-containing protein n=1 Tax=Fluctibacter halophilus TaxID=226011 RepID=A0ABS8G3L0_9ALTE|nr:PilZ domain-containing protein [Aestuariibacter halophilus]MCC2614711.1 PilZ domain-containing protein [Aestuariibacter halophilus]
MSQDLEQYHDIIEQLKPMINEPEFNQVLSQVAAHLPRQKRFLIKMELKRLARPCIRLIDLRGQVTGECREYEHEGRVHYLDDTAIEEFERQTRLFGQYTIGVYEAVKNTENNYRVMHKKQQQTQDSAESDQESAPEKPHTAALIQFGSYPSRREERMNYAVTIEMFTELNKSIQATTIDISVSGLKVKVGKDHMFKPQERLVIQFRGLEGEYTLDKKNGIPYSVVGIDRSRKEQRLHLQRLYDQPAPGFDAFLERFIHGNKRRYKVNMENTLEAIHNKTYEQYFTPNFPSAPVYIETVKGQYRPRFVLANDCNRDLMHYWSDEQFELRLGYMFSHERLARLIEMPPEQRETFVFVFNHIKNERVYFYSASREELFEEPQLMQVFLGYASRKASWRVYKVQLCDMTLQQAHMPTSLPDAVSDTVKRQNQPPTPRLLARLKNLTHIALVTDVTDDVGTDNYSALPIRRDEVSRLKVFGHPRNRPPASIDMFRFKYHNQRKETRYQLRTKVILTVDGEESMGLDIEGSSEDISVRGLKIELHKTFHGSENTPVLLSFPNLQSLTQKYNLQDLPYRIRNITGEGNVLHLQAVSDEHNSTAQRFFDELIRNNRSRLKAYKEEEDVPGIGAALRNLYARNVQNVGFFIKKDGVNFSPDALVSSQRKTRLLRLLSHDAEPGQLNLHCLYSSNGIALDFIQYTLKNIKTHKMPVMRELFVAFDPRQSSAKSAIRSCFTDQFHDDEERLEFINQAIGSGQFIAIKVFLARTGRPDMERLQSELNYIGTYAIHRAKELEEQLWGIVGVGDLVDVTDEVLLRYRFSRQHIQANRQTPAAHSVESTHIEELLRV